MSDAIWLALIAAISGGAIAALITGAFQQPKTRAEAAKLVAESGEVLDQRWQSWASKLEKRVGELERQLAEKDHQITELQQALEREKWVTRMVIAWALGMRDEIRRLGGVVADPPQEVAHYIDEIA